jgi:hypothetical protein
MLSSEQNVQEPIAIGCDATEADSSNEAGTINKKGTPVFLKFLLLT